MAWVGVGGWGPLEVQEVELRRVAAEELHEQVHWGCEAMAHGGCDGEWNPVVGTIAVGEREHL